MIALGSDQGGFEVKQEIIAYLEKNQIAYKDFGRYDTKSVDYPVYAKFWFAEPVSVFPSRQTSSRVSAVRCAPIASVPR